MRVRVRVRVEKKAKMAATRVGVRVRARHCGLQGWVPSVSSRRFAGAGHSASCSSISWKIALPTSGLCHAMGYWQWPGHITLSAEMGSQDEFVQGGFAGHGWGKNLPYYLRRRGTTEPSGADHLARGECGSDSDTGRESDYTVYRRGFPRNWAVSLPSGPGSGQLRTAAILPQL